MKVLQLIDSLVPGGAERMCVNIANVLHEEGIPVIVCATRRGGSLQVYITQGLPVYQLGKKYSLDIIAFGKLLKIIKKESITHIHAHSSSVFWAVGASLIIKNIKVIWHDHYGQCELLKPGDRKLLSFISRYIDFAIPVNQVLAKWIISNMNIPESRVLYLPNFPLLKSIKPYPTRWPIVLCLAHFRSQKNHQNLLKAIALIKEQVSPFQVILAGMPGSSDYMRAMHQSIATLGLADIISVMHSLSNSEQLLEQASVGVLSSDSEGLPLALLEYGLAGLPVVATRVGQCAEVLEEGRCGRLVQPNDPEALAEALCETLRDIHVANEMGKRLCERVQTHYSGAAFLKGYLPLLK